MAQHDYDLANQAGAAFRADLNNALLAAASQNSGASAPSPTFAHMPWPDTTTGIFKIRNDANTAWISVFYLATGKAVANPNTTDASGGVVGLTLFAINFKNALNTFTSFFTNSNTAARTYTFQDKNGTIADTADVSTAQAAAISSAVATAASDATSKANAAQAAAIAAAAQATATIYGIGSPILGRPADTTDYAAGSEIAGTSLYTCSSYNFRGSSSWSITPDPVLINTGNWRCTSRAYGNGSNGYAGVWVRIS